MTTTAAVRQGQRPQARRRDRRRTSDRADRRFEYFGLRTVYDRYLLRHPPTRLVIETPQYFLLRVACGLARTPGARRSSFYRLMSPPRLPAQLAHAVQLRHPAPPDVLAATCSTRPRDELDSIYDRYAQVARLSKFAGGIGIAVLPGPLARAR